MYFWVKTAHLVFVIAWMATVFYLPRILVNLAMVAPDSHAERERLLLMGRKLLRFTTMLAVPALGLGLWLWLGWWRGAGGWLHAKLFFVLLVIGYHHACAVLLRKIANGTDRHSHVWYRWFYEVPVVALVIIVVLAVVKPF